MNSGAIITGLFDGRHYHHERDITIPYKEYRKITHQYTACGRKAAPIKKYGACEEKYSNAKKANVHASWNVPKNQSPQKEKQYQTAA
jgi:hypothetical protein